MNVKKAELKPGHYCTFPVMWGTERKYFLGHIDLIDHDVPEGTKKRILYHIKGDTPYPPMYNIRIIDANAFRLGWADDSIKKDYLYASTEAGDTGKIMPYFIQEGTMIEHKRTNATYRVSNIYYNKQDKKTYIRYPNPTRRGGNNDKFVRVDVNAFDLTYKIAQDQE